MRFRFNKTYALLFAVLVIAEILIVLYGSGDLRNYAGDILVMGLIYCFLLAFMDLNRKKTIIWIGVFALVIEVLQLIPLVGELGLQNNRLATTILGTQFDFNDLWAYVAGCGLIYLLEFYDEKPSGRKRKLF